MPSFSLVPWRVPIYGPGWCRSSRKNCCVVHVCSCSVRCVSYLVAYGDFLKIGPTDLVLWVDILSRMFSGSVSALCPLLCLKKSITVLRREALVEAFAFSWSSTCSGGTFSLASCADCLLRFIRGRPKGNALRPASSSSAVLKRPKRILQGIQAEPRRHQKKREVWTRKKETDWKGYKPKKARQPLLQAANERIGPGPTRQPHQPGTCMHRMTRTVSTCYSQVEEHGRLAPAGCTVTLHPRSRNPERGGASARAGCGQVRQATTDELLLTAGSRGRRVAIRPA